MGITDRLKKNFKIKISKISSDSEIVKNIYQKSLTIFRQITCDIVTYLVNTMVFSKILQILLGHPQISGRIIQRLADSWPIRRAAKFTAYIYLRGKHTIEEGVKPHMRDVSKIDAQRFGQTFKEELKKQWEEAKKQAESQSRRPR